MIQKYLSVILLLALAACGNRQTTIVPAENATDAGREFVRAALDGDYVKAEAYLYKDSMNLTLFEQQQSNYRSLSQEQRRSYQESSIRPVAITPKNDSLTLFSYYHSANPKDTTNLRIMKVDGKWLVDLKSVLKLQE